MSIGPESEQEFSKIVSIAVQEAASFITVNSGQNCELSYSRLVDSTMTSDKVAAKAASALLVLESNYGPISIIIAADNALPIIASLNGSEVTEISEEDLATLNSLFHGAITAIATSFKSQHEALNLEVSEASSKLITPDDESSLDLPVGVEDSVGMGIKLKFGENDSSIQVEANAALIEYLVSELAAVSLEFKGTEAAGEAAAPQARDPNAEPTEEEIQQAIRDALGIEKEDEDEDDDDEDGGFNPKRNLSFMRGVNMELVLELGRSEMPIKDVLSLARGSAIELDRPVDRPIDLYVHNKLVARGEVVAIDDNFGFRITELTGDLDLVSATSALRPD